MKKILYVFLSLGVIYFVLALFGPAEIKVERSIYLEQTKSNVKTKLLDFNYFHKNWNPWSEADSALAGSFKGHPGEVGHQYSWSGNTNVGQGEVEITGISNDSIYQSLSYKNKGEIKSYLIVRDSAQGCIVSWGMIFPVSFLGRTPMLFVDMDEMIGKDYEKGLNKLKAALI